MKNIQKLAVLGAMVIFLSLIVLILPTTRSEAQVMQVSCDAAPGCSYPQRTDSSCGPQVCAAATVSCTPAPGCTYPQRTSTSCGPQMCPVVNTDPIPVVSTSVSCDPPSGCSYPQRTQTSCGPISCIHVNTDPIPVTATTSPVSKVQEIISSIKKQIAILQALLGAMLHLRSLGVHVD